MPEHEADGVDPFEDEEAPRHAVDVLVQSRHYVRWKLIWVSAATLFLSIFAGYLILFHHARYAFAMVVTLGLCLVIALAPQVGLWTYYLLGFARPQDAFWGLADVRLSLYVAGIALLAWGGHTGVKKGRWIDPRPQTWLMLGLGLLIGATALVHGGDWDRATEFVKLLVVAVVLAAYMTRQRWIGVTLKITFLSFAFLTLWGLYQHFGVGYPEIHGPGVTGDGYLYDRNDYAMFIVMGIPFFWYLGMRSRRLWLRWGLMALAPAAVYTVMLTSSRGGLLGAGAVVLTIAWSSRHRVLATVGGGLIMVLFYLLFAPAALKDRASTIVDYEEDRSAEGRLESWSAGLTMMAANPVLGVGPDNYVRAYGGYARTQARQAHNSWIQMGAEYGVSGLAILILLQILTVRDLLRLRRRFPPGDELHDWSTMLLVSLAGYAVCGFFLSQEAFEIFYAFVAIAMAMTTVGNRREEEAEDGEGMLETA